MVLKKYNFYTIVNKEEVIIHPTKAIHWIQRSEVAAMKLLAPILEPMESERTSDVNVTLWVDKIHLPIYNAQRSNLIAVVFVNYLMPQMNGIAFCKKLNAMPDLKAESILLTAEADEHTAIKAFNAGWIHKFLLKLAGPKLNKNIMEVIQVAQQRYFQKLSEPTLQNLGAPFRALLNNYAFQTIFYQTYKKANATEYYLVDPCGSYVFFDDQMQASWLIVRSNDMIDETVEMLTANDIDTAIIELIKCREKMLFLPSEQDYQHPEALTDYLFDAQPLDKSHYYSLVMGNITALMDWNKVKPCR